MNMRRVSGEVGRELEEVEEEDAMKKNLHAE